VHLFVVKFQLRRVPDQDEGGWAETVENPVEPTGGLFQRLMISLISHMQQDQYLWGMVGLRVALY